MTMQARYKVVANIPYYITSAIIRHLLEAEHQAAVDRADDPTGSGPAHHRPTR